MVYKIASPKVGHVRVLFELPSTLWANLVYVVGNFNGSEPATSVRLSQERDGHWRGVVDLPIGQRFEFRYLIDGRWCCDCHSISPTAYIIESPRSLLYTFAWEN